MLYNFIAKECELRVLIYSFHCKTPRAHTQLALYSVILFCLFGFRTVFLVDFNRTFNRVVQNDCSEFK